MKIYASARFLTRTLDIKVRWVFEVFFSEIRHTLGSVRHCEGLERICYYSNLNWIAINE